MDRDRRGKQYHAPETWAKHRPTWKADDVEQDGDTELSYNETMWQINWLSEWLIAHLFGLLTGWQTV
jgi:hypothetical protein